MAKARLTDKFIRALKPTSAQVDYWDQGFTGAAFGIRVAPSGRKTFTMLYRTAQGVQRRYSVGLYPAISLSEARKTAYAALGRVIRGEDPAADRDASRLAPTFGAVFRLYMEEYAKPNKRTWRNDQWMADKDLLPVWKNRRLSSVTRWDVEEVLVTIKERNAPVAANRTRSLISRVFTFAMKRDLCAANPALLTDRPPEVSRERVLTDPEIRAVWTTASTFPPVIAAVFKLRLLTAQRGIEVRTMRWADIADDVWTLPAEVVKNKKSHRVPLSPQAMALLEELRPLTGSGTYVLPAAPGADHPVGHLNEWCKKLYSESKVPEFIPHDLRRTASTCMTERCGVTQFIVGRILNHTEKGVTKIYDRGQYMPEMRRALSAWGELLEAILAKKARESVLLAFPKR